MSVKNNKKTLVFGASLKPQRVSHKVIERLLRYGEKVVAVGGRKGKVSGIDVLTGHPALKDIHTITMYMGEKRQEEHQEYLLSLHPRRIIFNPGAENPEFAFRARQMGIETMNACTLVMLATGQY